MGDRWYDHNGTNFVVPLNPSAAAVGPLGSTAGGADDRSRGAALSSLDLPQLPEELCNVWAWIKWDAEGRPSRDRDQAEAEFQLARAAGRGLSLARAC